MPAEDSAKAPLTWKEILKFQIGDASAIRRILSHRGSLLVGAVLVITAGMARRYDQDSLISNPRWLYLPFAVAGITSFLVFASVWAFGISRYRKEMGIGKSRPTFWSSYLGFLGAFLMTAPLAWLYAIPVESHTDLLTAAKWNTAFLAIVSLWRVILMVRVFQVGWGLPFWHTLVAVLLPTSLEATVGAFFQNLNLVGMMGGILPPHQSFLARVSVSVYTSGLFIFVVSLLAMLIFGILTIERHGFRKQVFELALEARLVSRNKRLSVSSLVVPFLCLIVWIVIAFTPQTRVWRSVQFDHLTHDGKFVEAMEFLRHSKRSDFPSGFRITKEWQFSNEEIIGLLGEVQPDEPTWIRETLLSVSQERAEYIFTEYKRAFWEEDLPFLRSISSHPEGAEWLASFIRSNPWLVSNSPSVSGEVGNDAEKETQESFRTWLTSIGIDPSELDHSPENDSTLSDQRSDRVE